MRSTVSVNQAKFIAEEPSNFASCNHSGIHICSECRENLFRTGQKIELSLSSAGRLACAIASAKLDEDSYTLRNIAMVISDITSKAITVRHRFLESFEQNQAANVRLYNQLYRKGNGLADTADDNWLSEAQRTGEIFPGRPQVRPRITFGSYSRKENAQSCRKNYLKSGSYSPGIFTVQCVCRQPKLIGVSVMRECEGVSTTLSVLLSRFRVLPRVCYYDNACNMSRFITLRCPWVYDNSIVVCDRFHYQGHTCNSICDPSSYGECSNHATSGAESVNHLWNFSKSYLRFLRPDNLIPFLAIRSIFLNVKACVRQVRNRQDISVQDIRKYVRNKWPCQCNKCIE